jgi:hypothetical protein
MHRYRKEGNSIINASPSVIPTIVAMMMSGMSFSGRRR